MKIQDLSNYNQSRLSHSIWEYQDYLGLLIALDHQLFGVDRSDWDWHEAENSFLRTLIVRDEVEEALTKVRLSATNEVSDHIAFLDRRFKRLIGVFLDCNKDRRRQNVWPMEGNEHNARQPIGWWWTYRINCDGENHTCQICTQDKVDLTLLTAIFLLLPYGLLCPTGEELDRLTSGRLGRRSARHLSAHVDRCRPCLEKILRMEDAQKPD